MAAARQDRKPFALRDLEWVIRSPFLLKDAPVPKLGQHAETEALLARLKADPEPLLAHLAATSRLNLGRYFEQLVIFWLTNLPSISLVTSNIPIFREKRSLGEIDLAFLYEGQAYHWELSIKFYLNIGSTENEADFVGPMLKDTLKRKLDRLYDHQLQLPIQQETVIALAERGLKDIISSPWVKGCLFYPRTGDNETSIPPYRVSKDSLTGAWQDRSHNMDTSLPDFDHFLILDKKRWLTPYFYGEEALKGNKAALFEAVDHAFSQRRMPYLVQLMRDDGDNILSPQGPRLFIVPEGWPG
ncbi:DUF1853 family protein [Sneathiella litorea]|uniref:DUF1853 family protein n=1 Tax=Sneathiella litorea TaxID=2606216 RepID=A0A6L8WBJ9_9PROT|nr:DUF1853 family protein [Sneathiella litorea]MZR31803.1 DUF1853 family protein [Sneathiella litorea]